jgi:hypothetical protein
LYHKTTKIQAKSAFCPLIKAFFFVRMVGTNFKKREMKNKIIISVCTIGLLFVFTGCQQTISEKKEIPSSLNLWQKQEQNEPIISAKDDASVQEKTKIVPQEASINSIEKSDAQLISLAISENNPQLCTNITNANSQEYCLTRTYIDIALSQQDLSLCQKLSSVSAQTRCFSQITENKALHALDLNECARITEAKKRIDCETAVILRLAVQEKSISRCGQIPESYSKVKQRCMEKVNQVLTRTAYAQATQTFLSVEKCQEIANQRESIKCQDVVNLKLAMKENNINLCQEITDLANKNKCLTILGANLAQSNKEANYCEYIPEENQKLQCQKNVAVILNRDYFRQAKQEKNIDLCQQITDSTLKNECLNTFIN